MKILGKIFMFYLFIIGVSTSFIYAQPSSDNYERNHKRWKSLSQEQRLMIRERAQTLSPDQIERFRLKAQKFKKLPQEDRQRIRNNQQRLRGLSTEQRQQLRQRHRQFRKMPPEQRQALRQKFRQAQHPEAENLGISRGGKEHRRQNMEQRMERRLKKTRFKQSQSKRHN